MSFGLEEIYNKLNTDTTVTDLLPNYEDSDGNIYKAIFPQIVVPLNVPLDNSTINIYRSQPIDGGVNFGNYIHTINCRASSQTKAEALSDAVFESLNRYRSGVWCQLLETIKPFDEEDNWNSIVFCNLKKEVG